MLQQIFRSKYLNTSQNIGFVRIEIAMKYQIPIPVFKILYRQKFQILQLFKKLCEYLSTCFQHRSFWWWPIDAYCSLALIIYFLNRSVWLLRNRECMQVYMQIEQVQRWTLYKDSHGCWPTFQWFFVTLYSLVIMQEDSLSDLADLKKRK